MRKTQLSRRVLPVLLGSLLVVGMTTGPFRDADAGGLRAGSHSAKGHHRHGRHDWRQGHRRHFHRSHYYPYYGYYEYYGYPFHRGYGYGPYWGRHRPLRSGVRETRMERGFRYLAEGDRKRAVSVFAKLAEAEPSNALPKLGYAIAMSELDELELGVWAMRRAVRTDAEALRNAPLGVALRPRVRALLDVYHPDHGEGPDARHHEDAHFMVAALLWVLGDYAGASSAAQWAIAGGDDDPSTRVLAEAIAERRSTALEPADLES